MATNHWVNTAFDGLAWAGGTVLTNLDIAIPAGATLKRFVIDRTRMQGRSTGVGILAVGGLILSQEVRITTAPYLGHVLFHQDIAIPATLAGFHDPLTAQRIYTMYYNGADESFTINERTAFGLRSGPGFTVRYSSSVRSTLGFTGGVGDPLASANFRALYETVP